MEIDRKEVLRYLGHRGQSTEGLEEKLDEAIRMCRQAVTPRCVTAAFDLEREPLRLKGTDIILHGNSIAGHLSDCRRVWLIGATIGFETEKAVARLMYDDPVLAIMLDSAATCALESYLDDVCNGIEAETRRALTWRFSCGYGDFPISQQADFVRLLDLGRKIGVYMNESYMLSPQKSVTAIAGEKVSDGGRRMCINKCAVCDNKDCRYRKA